MKYEGEPAGHLLSTSPPEGYTEESWQRHCATMERLGEIIGPIPPAPPRCIQALRDGKCYIYFIGGDDTPIKIGFSAAPFERLATLQTAHWAKLRILAKVEGTFETEDAYHARFSDHRMQGEWFARHPDILAEIERLSV